MRAVEGWLESRDDEEVVVVTSEAQLAKEPLRFETDRLVDAPAPVDEQPTAPLRTMVKIIYAMADVGPTAFTAIQGFYLNAFLLEVARMPAQVVGILLLIAKLADALADPLIGWASDKTRSPIGRRKLWVMIFTLPMAALYVSQWVVPETVSESGLIAYYGVILVFFSMVLSAVVLPVNALAPELTSNYDERTSLMMFKVLFFSSMTIVATFVHSQLVGLFFYAPGAYVAPFNSSNCSALNNATDVNAPVPNVQLGYLVSGIVFAVVSVPPLVLLLLFVPERKQGKPKKPIRSDGSVRIRQFTTWESFVTIITNRSFVCVTLIYLFSQLAIQFVQNNLILFIKYVLKRSEWFSYILLALLGTACVSLPVWEGLSRRFGKSKMYLVGALIGIATFLSAFFMSYYGRTVQAVMIWVTAFVGGFAIGALFLIPVAMLPDAITQDELTTGTRREGIFYAFFILFQKVALAVAVAISNFVLAASGYVPPESAQCEDPIQAESVQLAMSLMIGIVPAVIMSLSLVALFFYPVTKELHLDTLRKLQDEKDRNALITTDGEFTAQVSADI